MKKITFIFLALGFLTLPSFSQEEILFHFDHKTGQAVSHVATVEEESYINGRLNNKIQFINRVSTKVLDVEEDGSASIETHYMITENALLNNSGRSLSWGEEDDVKACRKANGELYEITSNTLPTVRNLPVFPDYPVSVGESWQKDGLEIHDMRSLFEMDEIIQIPFTAYYTYTGTEEQNGKTLHVIELEYEYFQDNTKGQFYRATNYAGVRGYVQQKLYWDSQNNDLDHYDEEFQIKFVDFYGNLYLFTGLSHGNVTEYKSLNNEENAKKLENSVKKYNLDDITVKQGEKGLTLSLENIQFEPDSDRLLPSEKNKLKKIGQILKEFSNDLLITGHTALRGTEKERQKLSEKRAEAVADFLINEGVRDQYHVYTQGKGASEPAASNETEEGRKKNRRVEITIMD